MSTESLTSSSTLSLRERKRAATRAAIEAAALDLVLADGPEATTVDAIAARAGVSQRTFFNYFDSKDAAILGVHPGEADEALLAAYRAEAPHADTVRAVVRLVMTLTGAHQCETGTHLSRRREVLRRHPEVLASQAAQLTQRADALTDTVRHLLAADPYFSRSPEATDLLADQASVVLMAAAVAVRRSVEAWALAVSAGPAPADVERRVEDRAVALVRATAQGLS